MIKNNYIETVRRQKAAGLEAITAPTEAASFLAALSTVTTALAAMANQIDIGMALGQMEELRLYFEAAHAEFLFQEGRETAHKTV